MKRSPDNGNPTKETEDRFRLHFLGSSRRRRHATLPSVAKWRLTLPKNQRPEAEVLTGLLMLNPINPLRFFY